MVAAVFWNGMGLINKKTGLGFYSQPCLFYDTTTICSRSGPTLTSRTGTPASLLMASR